MSERSDRLYVLDIKEAIEAIYSYVDGISREDFKLDRMRFSAVIREFEVIGEAVGKLNDEVKKNYPDIHWQDIKDFRNMLIHEYFGVDLDIVWNVIQEDMPVLFRAIIEIERANT